MAAGRGYNRLKLERHDETLARGGCSVIIFLRVGVIPNDYKDPAGI
jgi:hypothetical protein